MEHVGVPIIGGKDVSWFIEDEKERTTYYLDVRDPTEYAKGHPPGFVNATGGELVQAIGEWIAVRGARIVLWDTDGVRARMAASWLHQMGWDVLVLEHGEELPSGFKGVHGPSWKPQESQAISVTDLKALSDVTVLDLARSPVYRKGHIPNAQFCSGPELPRIVQKLEGSGLIVLTSSDGRVAAANVPEAQHATSRTVLYLSGGTEAWRATGLELETTPHWLREPTDVYKRPYEGTDNAKANMQAYIDWELQLVAQLANDGVSGFHVTRSPK